MCMMPTACPGRSAAWSEAERCAADPGPRLLQPLPHKKETGVPHLRCTAPLRYALHRVRDTRVAGSALDLNCYSADMRYFVYILASRYKGTLYVGMANNLSRRLEGHRAGSVPGFTRTYKVHRLVYYEEYASLLEARARERVLKRWRREWKFKLIESVNPSWRDLTPDLVAL